ncbi:TfuA-like protein [Marinomonas spartinae]|uniref:TfuA-like protein n=1 Tax=Marinomonas spartinae TaxID=1792290 RepID=A0A1A8TQN5_9GAMM|nr:TfuA-like protein [Marinomonas spartinae]SBS35448.1 TfuA-like protein [Marinomonas spartinae]
MSIIVFAGPTIRKDTILKTLPAADIRPPAKQGDLYLATRDNPKIILLIDGFFESVPAVWHKEILYAMSTGIHVYGSSSMGALRASELHSYGMVGVGVIFEKFAHGEWEDDDEVALTHGPMELGYPSVSRAMADLRYDLARACEREILTPSQAETIASKLKSLWYPERSHDTLCSYAEELLTQGKMEQLSSFLKTETQSLKEKDATVLIKQIADIDLNNVPPKTINYVLQENDAWQTLINDVSRSRLTKVQVDLPSHLSPEHTKDNIFQSKLRALALEHAEDIGIEYKPWVRLAFEKVVSQWGCVTEEGQIQFEKVSDKIVSLSLTTEQFDRWIEREALLMAYADQIEIKPEHIADESLLRQGAAPPHSALETLLKE